jgi:SAM-dependent methyltransferase
MKLTIIPSFLRRKNQSHTRRQLEEWLQELTIVAAAVADVGGRKLPVQDRVKFWQVQSYDILDLPEYDLNLEWNLTELYDVVFCLETFEYIFNPFQAMKNLYGLLKKGGILYASFHFLYPHHGSEDYLRYTRRGVERLLQETGFSGWEILPRKIKHALALHALYLREGMQVLNYHPGRLHTEQGYLVRAVK